MNLKSKIKLEFMKGIYSITAVFISICLAISCSDDEIDSIQPQSYPEIVNGTFTFQNRDRIYTLHIPETFDGTQAAPLVIFLHGGGGNAQSAQNFTGFNEVSKQEGFLMLYPQGVFESSPNSFVWADGRGLAPDVQGIDDVGFINALVDFLVVEYTININKIYLCGFSNGSFLTQKIAFEANSKFAAIGTLGGTLHQSFHDLGNPNRPIPMIYFFGTDDPFVPYNGGYVSNNPNFEPIVGVEDAVEFWKINNNTQSILSAVNLPDTNTNDNSTVTVFEYINGNCNRSKVKFYKINGGGHTWPGVEVPNPSLGATNLDINASQELWNFFKQFELCL